MPLEVELVATVRWSEYDDFRPPDVELIDLGSGRAIRLGLRATERSGEDVLVVLEPLAPLTPGHEYAVQVDSRPAPYPGRFLVRTDEASGTAARGWILAALVAVTAVCALVLARRRRQHSIVV